MPHNGVKPVSMINNEKISISLKPAGVNDTASPDRSGYGAMRCLQGNPSKPPLRVFLNLPGHGEGKITPEGSEPGKALVGLFSLTGEAFNKVLQPLCLLFQFFDQVSITGLSCSDLFESIFSLSPQFLHFLSFPADLLLLLP